MKRFLPIILAVLLAAATAPGLAAGGNAESYEYSWLDCSRGNGVYKSVDALGMQFKGEVLAVELSDFTDVRLIRDGVEVEVKLGGEIQRWVKTYGDEIYTYFTIPFSEKYIDLGAYKLYAAYQGVSIKSDTKLLEGPLSDTPADPAALEYVTYWRRELYNKYNLSLAKSFFEPSFHFRSKQDAFNPEDLTELELTRSGFEVPVSLASHSTRYPEYSESLGAISDTCFSVYMEKEITESGVYKLTGKYLGTAFESETLIILSEAQLALLDTAHYWAAEPLSYALAYGLVPDDISADFSMDATRAEFCRMAVRALEAKYGKGISEILSSRGKTAEPVFTDTSDPDILAAAALGIVSGIGGGIFAPDANIERQQAAVMLKNLCAVIGTEVSGAPASGFSDDGEIAPWARDAVNFVSSAGIMSGDGMRFMPKEAISREQSAIVLANVLR